MSAALHVLPARPLERNVFAFGSVVDEATGRPIAEATVEADTHAIDVRMASGGLFAMHGIAPPGVVALTFRAPRHRDQTLTVAVPPSGPYPIEISAVQLRPLAVRLEGRVTTNAKRAPLAGARISVTKPDAVLLRTVAHVDHAAGVAITPQTLTATGAAAQLASSATAGATAIVVDDASGFAAGDVVRAGEEYGVVDSVDTATRRLSLRHPLVRSHAANAAVQVVTATAAGAPVATTRSIDAGDGLLLLATAMTADAIEISDPPRLEYHDTDVITDANGFFAAEGIGGVRMLTLNAFWDDKSVDREWSIDASRPLDTIGFRLKP